MIDISQLSFTMLTNVHFLFWKAFILVHLFLACSHPSQIGRLPYFHTMSWCDLSANLRCRSETCCTRLAEIQDVTRRPASADRTASRQFQATGHPVSRTHDRDAMTSRLPHYEAKCVQHRCFQCGSVPLRSDIKGTELPSANRPILIPLERQLIALQLCRWLFYITKFCSRLFVFYCRNCPKDNKFRYFIPILRKLGAA